MSDGVLTWEKLVQIDRELQEKTFSLAFDVPTGQHWAEFEKDGKKMGAVLLKGLVYTFPMPEPRIYMPTFDWYDWQQSIRKPSK